MTTITREQARAMPTLPQSLLNLIGEYGMARTDGVGEAEILYRWDALIGGIKDYARSVVYVEPAQPQQDAPQFGGLAEYDIVQIIADNSECSKNGDEHGYSVVYERHAKAIARAILAQAAPVQQAGHVPDGWLPIETAPKDGTKILVGHFQIGSDRNGLMSVDWYRQPKDGAGYIGFGHFNKTYFPATHWMPLPAAPQPGEKG